MQAQQQLAEAQARAAETMAEQEDPDAPEERDLDDEIPEAEVTDGDVTFNEDSMMEGSMLEQQEQEQYAELEEAELTGAARDEEDLGIERDLDDDVPEAGSYQHTDTEEEDSSSDVDSSEVQDSFAQQSARRSTRSSARQQQQQQMSAVQTPALSMGSLQERMRAQVGAADSLPRSPGSLNLSSSVLESSFVGSSPMMQRGNQGGRGRGTRGRGRLS